MTDHHTYKKVELVGSSTSSIEDAINNALAEANKSIKHLEWFEVTETRG
ncbi:dodecin, partial [Pseudomonas sp.]